MAEVDGPFNVEVDAGQAYLTYRHRRIAQYTGPWGQTFDDATFLIVCANAGLAAFDASERVRELMDAERDMNGGIR